MKQSIVILLVVVASSYLVFLSATLGFCIGTQDKLSPHITVKWGFAGCQIVKEQK